MIHTAHDSRTVVPDKCQSRSEMPLNGRARVALNQAVKGHVKRFALDLGMSRTRFRAYIENPEVRNPIETVNQIFRTAQEIEDERFQKVVETALDGTGVTVIRSDIEPKPASLATVNKEIAEFIVEYNKSMENGKIEPHEWPKLMKEGGELLRVVGGVLAKGRK